MRGSTGRRSVAAEHDLVVRADGHSLGEIAVRVRNREARLDQHGVAIDHRNRAPWPGAVHWNVLIEFSSLRTPLALLEAAGGVDASTVDWPAERRRLGTRCAVKHELAKHLMRRGRDEGDEGRGRSWDSPRQDSRS